MTNSKSRKTSDAQYNIDCLPCHMLLAQCNGIFSNSILLLKSVTGADTSSCSAHSAFVSSICVSDIFKTVSSNTEASTSYLMQLIGVQLSLLNSKPELNPLANVLKSFSKSISSMLSVLGTLGSSKPPGQNGILLGLPMKSILFGIIYATIMS
ncbi:hypothetical protein ALC57_08490 [Trachymyrmex cornetzi]|uniref:Uncharacterized protein n=1 Tax=Trachymyrmex cornetzi TaxID=471704 RepID=A0A195E2M0_9HYME|nr:hypothetical protein ALC57_08490 [Trachymyrmex cornetzi]